MAGDLVQHFPDLLSSNPPRLRVSDSSNSRVSLKIDIIGTSLPPATVLPPVSWKDKVVEGVSAPRMDLQFFPPAIVNEKIVVQPPEEVVTLGNEKWKDCVVGYFIDRKLPFTTVKSIAEKIWAKFGLIDVLSNDEGLSYVASALGRPLYADRMTETCKRLNYAKICVEIDVNYELLDSFDVVLANGDTFPIKVWHPWKPLKCDKCKVFGHKPCQDAPSGSLKVDSKQVWVVKAKQSDLQTVEQAQEETGLDMVPSTIIEALGVQRATQVCDSHQVGIKVSGVKSVVSPTPKNNRVLESRDTSDPNKFAVLQSLSEEVVVILPSEAKFTAGMIEDVDIIDVPPVQKGKGRGGNKKQLSK
ncbi:hypothetical protein RHGRI_001788 [Rhododendron griersonianum]|uniref:DUF4283 domain-containing protein n=1 Tax=Rhododendron griersonianum TaxID=479676 RepID=A0AAV6LLE1_9ERIC|nr:hypothetical protein RHGRI_001788 [Rhododendron griersonianum]